LHPLVKKLAGQTVIYGFSTIIGRLLNYLLVPLYTRIFHPAEYGIVTELYAYTSFLNVLFTYGMETAYFRYATLQSDKKKVFDTAFISILISSIGFVLFFVFFAQPIATFLKYPDHANYILWFAFVWGLDALCAIPFARLRQENRPIKYATIKLINIGVNIFLNLFYLIFCPMVLSNNELASFRPFVNFVFNPHIRIGYVFIANLVSSAITLLLLLPYIIRKKYFFDNALWRRMLEYALPLLIVGLAGMINETFDRILLKFRLPLPPQQAMEQVGIYGACYKLSLLMTMFVMAFKMAAEPFFFSVSHQKDAKIIYQKTMNFFIIVCCVIFLFVMLFMNIFKYIVGTEYYSGLKIVPILLMANMCLGIYYNLTIWYKLTNRTSWGAYISIFGAAVTLAINFYFIPTLGYMASAWATFYCYSSMMVVSYLSGQYFFHVPYDLKRFFIYVGTALLLFFISQKIIAEWQLSTIADATANCFLLLIFIVEIFLLERKTTFSFSKPG
jgi:O-antigen/teichoic acid export membrane protein